MEQTGQLLHSRIEAVCPIHGVCWDERRIDFKEEATKAQRDAAQSVLDAFDPSSAQAEIDSRERERREWLEGGKDRFDQLLAAVHDLQARVEKLERR